MADLIKHGLKCERIAFDFVRSARDLGVDATNGAKRAVKVSKARICKGKPRASKIAVLAQQAEYLNLVV